MELMQIRGALEEYVHVLSALKKHVKKQTPWKKQSKRFKDKSQQNLGDR